MVLQVMKDIQKNKKKKNTYKEIVLDREGLRDDRDALDNLKALEVVFAAKARQLLLERLLDLGQGAQFLEALAIQAVAVRPDLERFGVGDHNAHQG